MVSEAHAIRCMLLPLTGINLLVPNSAVAEVIAYPMPRKLENTSDWFTGVALWRGIYVPVIEVEQMCGIGIANASHRARLAVLYNPEKDESMPYVGIHIQDIPRAYLAESATIKAASEMDVEQYIKCRVDDESLYRAIPDLDAIIVDLKKEYDHHQAQPRSS